MATNAAVRAYSRRSRAGWPGLSYNMSHPFPGPYAEQWFSVLANAGEKRMTEGQPSRRSRFGSDRFFFIGDQAGLARGWYMETREGLRGPFDTREDAEAMLSLLISAHPRKRVSNWHHSPRR